MSDSDEAKGLSPVPRPLTGVKTQPPARRRLGVNPRSLRHGQSEYWTALLLRPTDRRSRLQKLKIEYN